MQRHEFESIVQNSGLWDGNRKNTHRFILSPAVFEISVDQKETLTRLGEALQDCLAGFGCIANIACRTRTLTMARNYSKHS